MLLVCHPLFQMCENSSDIPCQAVPLCFSSCTVKSISRCTVSSTPLIPTQYLLQLSLSTAVCHSISRTRLQEASSLQQAKCQAKLSHAKYYPLLQDSYNTLFKRNLFPFASVPKARDTHAKVLLQPEDGQFTASQGLGSKLYSHIFSSLSILETDWLFFIFPSPKKDRPD